MPSALADKISREAVLTLRGSNNFRVKQIVSFLWTSVKLLINESILGYLLVFNIST